MEWWGFVEKSFFGGLDRGKGGWRGMGVCWFLGEVNLVVCFEVDDE